MQKSFKNIATAVVLGAVVVFAIYKFKNGCGSCTDGCSTENAPKFPEVVSMATTDSLGDARAKFKAAEILYLNARNSDVSARDALKAKSQAGDYGAKTSLAMLYLFGGKDLFIDKDHASALFAEVKEGIQKWADEGIPEAQTAFGLMHQHGMGGISKNEQEAVRLYKLSADQGHMLGQNCLGWMYDQGVGIEQNSEEGFKYYKLAADQGHSMAQHNVGFMYEFGRGVKKDLKEAVKYYRLSAGQGHAWGLNSLGRMYRDGLGGLRQDDKEAVRLFKMALEHGDAKAQKNLGKMYEEGRGGLPKDEKEAVRLYKLSADQGHSYGQNHLGESYEKGIGGLPKDKEEAIRLYKLAATNKIGLPCQAAYDNLKRLGVEVSAAGA